MRKVTKFEDIRIGMVVKPIGGFKDGGIVLKIDNRDNSFKFGDGHWGWDYQIGSRFDVIDSKMDLPNEKEVIATKDEIKDALRYLIEQGHSDETILKAHKSNPQQWRSAKAKALYNINYYVMMQKLIEIEDDGKLQADKGVYEDETHLMPVDYNSMIDEAIDKGDKEWFNELVAKTKEVVG